MLGVNKIDNSVAHVIEDIHNIGYSVVENALPPELINQTTDHLYQVQEKIISAIGKEKLDKAREIGVLRLMMKYDPFFITFLNLPIIQKIVDHTVSETAIMHLQNGFINPPVANNIDTISQYQFHRDFPRILNGYMTSINIMVAVTDFTKDNGATLWCQAASKKTMFHLIATCAANQSRLNALLVHWLYLIPRYSMQQEGIQLARNDWELITNSLALT